MKKYLSKILSLVLVLACCLTVFMPVSAASDTAVHASSVHITYKGKTVTVGSPTKSLHYSTVKKAWGKATNQEKYSPYCEYTYKSGKTYIFIQAQTKKDLVLDLICDISNKKVKVDGISVGMKKAAAYKLLKKNFGKKNIKTVNGAYVASFGSNGFVTLSFNSKKIVNNITVSI